MKDPVARKMMMGVVGGYERLAEHAEARASCDSNGKENRRLTAAMQPTKWFDKSRECQILPR
jgi:hypothetical protein